MGDGDSRRRILMCEPGGYAVHHILNPWMEWTEAVDVRRAVGQWSALATALQAAGAQVEAMWNVSGSGAMTFTRDTAVVTAPDEALVLRNKGRRGDLEPEHITAWLEASGIACDQLVADERIDGGNVVPTTDGWVVGIPPGADVGAVRSFAGRLRDLTGATVHGVPIRDPKYGHLDTAFSDLAGFGWLVHAAALAQPDLTATAWSSIIRGRPVIEVDDDEAAALACNVIVIGDHVIGGLTTRLCREIERLGAEPVPVDLDEFRKAGGGAHCLTLELDPVHCRDRPPAHHPPTPAVPAT